MFLQMAWRNIWRNSRRTFVILTAIVIGVWNMIFLSAFTRGMETGMIKNGLSTLTGNIQIHQKQYHHDPVIENSMLDRDRLDSAINTSIPEGAHWTKRIRVNAIASNARHSAGIVLVGIDPKTEADVSFIKKAVKNGRYLTSDDTNKIVVGQALLEKFESRIGHKLVLMSQGTDKEIASRAFRIVGTFRAEMEATEKQFVFVNLFAAQKMLKIKNQISEISITLPERFTGNPEETEVTEKLKAAFSETGYSVETWKELLPMLSAYLKLSDSFIYIWYAVVFIAMGFGIVNTTLMAIFERMREFGLLKSLGMKPWWIIKGVLFESLFLLVLGIIIGNIFGFISVFLLSKSGIDLSAFSAGTEMWGMTRIIIPEIVQGDVIRANLVVLILGLLVSIYPAAIAARFTPVEALAKT